MIDPRTLIGAPRNFKDILLVYPPQVKEVVTNPNFNIFYTILTLTQDDIRDEIKDKL
jgi:hypothetical protein